jgi:hypothetical protein
MDQRERAGDLFEALRMALDGRQAGIWTACVGIVQSFDPVAITCVVQPAIQGRVTAKDGTASFVNMPLLLDCPVQFPGGGGVTMTFPVKKDDECLVVFANRCIDAWWQQGGIQPPMEARMHDLSDGCAFVGIRSQPRRIEGVSTTAAQLRADDGLTFYELDPAAQTVRINAPGGATINADVTINGALHVTGPVTFDDTLNVTGVTTVAEIDTTEVKIGGVVVVAP